VPLEERVFFLYFQLRVLFAKCCAPSVEKRGWAFSILGGIARGKKKKGADSVEGFKGKT